jgi:hypothetical protein
MNNFIDNYCERTGPEFWAEPVNALTNAAFLIAAALAFILARREGGPDWRALSLIGLVAVIGIGSFLFHTYATLWAKLADSLPILFYQILFLQLYAQRVMGMPCRYSLVLLGVFLLCIFGVGQLPYEWLNGSLTYAPALLFLTGFGIWHFMNARRERFILLIAAVVFTVSLAYRSVDMVFCEVFPHGVHFLWHLLNAVVLYLTTRAYILNRGGAVC